MSTFTGRLDQLEAQLQAFIEGKLARLSPLRGDQVSLARRVVSSMRAGAISSGDGILLAPDRFTVLAHPSQAEALAEDLKLLTELADLLQAIGKEASLHFAQPPIVSIASNEDVAINHIEIIARFSEESLGKTTDLLDPAENDQQIIPPNAFLIVNGTEILSLDQPVVNIGRRSNNHLVIDDPRVSRQHAQIRASRGRYEIFDLDSTGGTFVNKQRITKSLLRPGDVISIAGVPLIYGQETAGSMGRTKKYTPPENLDPSPAENQSS